MWWRSTPLLGSKVEQCLWFDWTGGCLEFLQQQVLPGSSGDSPVADLTWAPVSFQEVARIHKLRGGWLSKQRAVNWDVICFLPHNPEDLYWCAFSKQEVMNSTFNITKKQKQKKDTAFTSLRTSLIWAPAVTWVSSVASFSSPAYQGVSRGHFTLADGPSDTWAPSLLLCLGDALRCPSLLWAASAHLPSFLIYSDRGTPLRDSWAASCYNLCTKNLWFQI